MSPKLSSTPGLGSRTYVLCITLVPQSVFAAYAYLGSPAAPKTKKMARCGKRMSAALRHRLAIYDQCIRGASVKETPARPQDAGSNCLTTTERHNYDAGVNSGNPSGSADNQTVLYAYTDGLMTSMTADLPSGQTDQVTTYTYGTTKGVSAGDSKIATGHLLQKETYPDSANSNDVVKHAYNAQKEEIWHKDQAGNIIETDYDDSGRQTQRRVTTVASGFDNAVLRIAATYTSLGQELLVTQYDNATVGSGSVVNETKTTYDDWGNVEKYQEDRDSAVTGGGNDYSVSYTYAKATTGRNTVRRSDATLPSGNVITYEYLSTNNDDKASRLSRLKDGSVVLVKYDYLGVGNVVGITHDQPDVMWKMYSTSPGDYVDLDRFNRVTTSKWTKDLTSDKDFYSVSLTYDRNSNPTVAVDNVHTGFDVAYTIDNRDRVTEAKEGTWNGSAITSTTRDQQWTLSHTGNWDYDKLDLNGDGDFVDTDEHNDHRTHNDANELAARDADNNGSNNYTLTSDDGGNLTSDGHNYLYVYDPFYRLRKVEKLDTTLVSEYTYNGRSHLIGIHADTDNDGDVDSSDKWYYTSYDENWRPLATFRESDTSPKEEFVLHQAGNGGFGGSSYINAIICRYKDANTAWTSASDGVLEQVYYYCQNWRGDLSAIVTDAGAMVEWDKYSAYGIAFGLPAGDTNSDGNCNTTDANQIQTWINGSHYDVRGDLDLDGDVDTADKTTAQSVTQSLGRTLLTWCGNRHGLAGYDVDASLIGMGLHVRNRFFDASLGRFSQRDPIGYRAGDNLYEYSRGHCVAARDPDGLEDARCGNSSNQNGDGTGHGAAANPNKTKARDKCCDRGEANAKANLCPKDDGCDKGATGCTLQGDPDLSHSHCDADCSFQPMTGTLALNLVAAGKSYLVHFLKDGVWICTCTVTVTAPKYSCSPCIKVKKSNN